MLPTQAIIIKAAHSVNHYIPPKGMLNKASLQYFRTPL